MAFSTDKKLWRYGSKVAGNIGHGVAWELDFLRGMHQGNALRYLWTGQPFVDIRLP